MPKLTPAERFFYQRVGARIRELRNSTARPITQAELALKLGVKPNAVCRWESGEYRPTMLEAEAIARYFDVPISTLYSDREDQSMTSRINRGLRDLSMKDMQDVLTFITVKGEINRHNQK